jgi:hypothetical protein
MSYGNDITEFPKLTARAWRLEEWMEAADFRLGMTCYTDKDWTDSYRCMDFLLEIYLHRMEPNLRQRALEIYADNYLGPSPAGELTPLVESMDTMPTAELQLAIYLLTQSYDAEFLPVLEKFQNHPELGERAKEAHEMLTNNVHEYQLAAAKQNQIYLTKQKGADELKSG